MDSRFMRRALTLAKRFEGMTSPNPPVGAVVVSGGKIVGEGSHRGRGHPHAEAEALLDSGRSAKGADIYVTLEPCNHFGMTPPCTKGIISSGIKRVFIGMSDPNPDVTGGGARILKEAGIEVVFVPMGSEIERFYEAYTKFVTKKIPFVTIKAAMTLDGKIATSTGDSKWITSENARRYAHRLRKISDAVLVGIGTVRADDPQLTVRMARGRNPIRVVIDPDLSIDPDARLIKEGGGEVIIAAAKGADKKREEQLKGKGVEVVHLKLTKGEIRMDDLLVELGKRDVMRLLIEGGAKVFTCFLKYGIFDKITFMYAPKILTGSDSKGLTEGPGPKNISDSIKLRDVRIRKLGEDFIVEAYP